LMDLVIQYQHFHQRGLVGTAPVPQHRGQTQVRVGPEIKNQSKTCL
jgi:hypothetical protein